MSRTSQQSQQAGPVGRIETALFEAKKAGNFTFSGRTLDGKNFWLFDYAETGDLCGDRCRGAVLYEFTHPGYVGVLACNQFGPLLFREREAYFRALSEARGGALAVIDLGECRVTPGARDAAAELGVDLPRLLARHAGGDWGDVDAHDWAANDQAVKDGGRVISAYRFSETIKLWVITEADRGSTLVLLPDEY